MFTKVFAIVLILVTSLLSREWIAVWEPNKETDLAGYEISVWSEGSEWQKVKLGNVTEWRFQGGDSVAAVLRAYDQVGNVSLPSEMATARYRPGRPQGLDFFYCDTLEIPVPYEVKIEIPVPYPVHDTTIIHDTLRFWYPVPEPYPVHDTTYVTRLDTLIQTVIKPDDDTLYVDLLRKIGMSGGFYADEQTERILDKAPKDGEETLLIIKNKVEVTNHDFDRFRIPFIGACAVSVILAVGLIFGKK
jgi:hypothetical protein